MTFQLHELRFSLFWKKRSIQVQQIVFPWELTKPHFAGNIREGETLLWELFSKDLGANINIWLRIQTFTIALCVIVIFSYEFKPLFT